MRRTKKVPRKAKARTKKKAPAPPAVPEPPLPRRVQVPRDLMKECRDYQNSRIGETMEFIMRGSQAFSDLRRYGDRASEARDRIIPTIEQWIDWVAKEGCTQNQEGRALVAQLREDLDWFKAKLAKVRDLLTDGFMDRLHAIPEEELPFRTVVWRRMPQNQGRGERVRWELADQTGEGQAAG